MFCSLQRALLANGKCASGLQTELNQAYFIVLYWRGGHCCSMHCNRFKIYCAPSNLGMTGTWICRLNFTQRPIFWAWSSLTSLKSQTWDTLLKVPPGGLVLRIFTSWKNPSTSVGFVPANLGSRGEHVTPRPPRPTMTVNNQKGNYIFKLVVFPTFMSQRKE